MPQPLSRVKPDASIVINNAGHRALSERPDLAVLVSEAINSWSQVEAFLLKLFVVLFGGNEALAAKIYLALEIRTAKSSAIDQAIESVQDSKLRPLIKSIVSISKTNQKVRDKLAHNVWGISPNLPDSLLLADPKVLALDDMDRNDIYVYRASDLENIIDANDRLCGYGLQLMFILKGHVANRENRLFDQLCSQPEIAEKLDRLAKQAQSAPKAPT